MPTRVIAILSIIATHLIAIHVLAAPADCTAPRHCIYLPLIGGRFPVLDPVAGIVNGNFDAGNEGWREISDPPRILIRNRFDGSTRPRSGEWAAWLGNAFNSTSQLVQQVPVASGRPFLAYWYWIKSVEDNCGRNRDVAEIAVDPTPGDNQSAAVVVDSFALCKTENTFGWTKRTADLRAYSGRTVDVIIRVRTNADKDSNLFVDDMAFQATR